MFETFPEGFADVNHHTLPRRHFSSVGKYTNDDSLHLSNYSSVM